MSNDTLLAVPFFTFMGLILERSGMAEDLLDTIGQLFGPIRGGLAYAVIFVGALLAATTGVVAASVISMGLISLPIMLRYGYDRRVAAGVIAASGTLAQIIPPSLVLIVLADQLGRSVGDMYAGAFVPGFILTGFYALYILGIAIAKPQWTPALPLEARTLRGFALVERVIVSLLPPLILLLGLGAAMKIAIVFLGALFPVLINTIQGVRTVDPVLVDVARTFRRGVLNTVFGVVLPASLPMILSGMRVSLGLGFILVTLSEMLTGTHMYSGDNASQLAYQHVHSEVPKLPKKLSGYQPLLARLVAKKPDDRFQSARELFNFIAH